LYNKYIVSGDNIGVDIIAGFGAGAYDNIEAIS